MTTILIWHRSVTRSVKIGQESWGLSIADSFGRGRYPIAKNACWAIGCFSSSHFRLHAIGKVQKIGKWVPHELNDRQMEWRQKHMPNSACQTKKKVIPASGLWQAMKSGSIFRILNARNLGLIPSNHQHLPQDQSLRTEDDAVRLVGSGGCHLLRA